MSTRMKFIICIAVLFAVFAVAEYRMPRKFEWKPTFSHDDPQPFGCLVFDSVLAASMPNGYEVTRKSLWQMDKDSAFTTPKAVLIITKEDIGPQIKQILQLAARGNVVIVATTDLFPLCDTLGIGYDYHNAFQLSNIAGKRPEKSLLRLTDSSNTHRSDASGSTPRTTIKVYEQMIERTLTIPDSIPCEILAQIRLQSKDGHDSHGALWKPVAAAFTAGKGRLIVVSSPLLLTNYGMVSGDGQRFIAWLMDRVKHLPVIRSEGYMNITAQTEQTPLYALLQEPPLRWAVYLAALTVGLYCVFTARRRQRVIPVIRRPRNGNLDFARLIGTLYWQQHDNAGLTAKKLAYTAEELRRQTGIDIAGTDGLTDAALQQLAGLAGRDTEELRLLIKNIKQAASGLYEVSDQEMKTYIDEMDKLVKNEE